MESMFEDATAFNQPLNNSIHVHYSREGNL